MSSIYLFLDEEYRNRLEECLCCVANKIYVKPRVYGYYWGVSNISVFENNSLPEPDIAASSDSDGEDNVVDLGCRISGRK